MLAIPSPIFYCPEISGICCLDAEESAHAVRVLRLKRGNEIHLVNGKGGLYKAEMAEANTRKCVIKVLSKSIVAEEQIEPHLHLAVAPTKNIARYEWFLEKVTEIGISEITPLLCEHSERRVLKVERLQKILISAMKQSMNLFLPKLNQPENFSEFVNSFQSVQGKSLILPNGNGDVQKFIACYSNKHLKDFYQKGKPAVVLIGPEGDFSEKEITLAEETGFLKVSLGKHRLRTETAAIAACHTVRLISVCL